MKDRSGNPADPDRSTILTIVLALVTVAVVAAAGSYLHQLAVAQHADGHTLVALCLPALADLTILAASANLLDAYRHRERLPLFPIASLTISAVVTIAANVAAAHPAEIPVWLVNVWPPVAFMLALESLLGYTRRRALRGAVRVMPTGTPCPHGVGQDLAESVRLTYEHARDCEHEPLTYVALGAAFGLDRKRVAAMVTPGPAATLPPVLNGSSPDA
ncbi:MAG TPA: DUF2637 domain-containing protein [Streptosporangiaceae bacterium]